MVNKIILIGRIGRIDDLKYTSSGNPVCSFSLATSEKLKDKSGNKQKKTKWHNCVAWMKLAEIASQYLKKGSLVFIEGKMTSRSWDDKTYIGVKRTTWEVVVNEIKLLERKNEEKPEENHQQCSMDTYYTTDDIPF